MTVADLAYGGTAKPGDPFTHGQFDTINTVLTPRWVPDPTGVHPALLEMTCQQHDERCELLAGRGIFPNETGWLLYDVYLSNGTDGLKAFVPDPNWTTMGQIHYMNTFDMEDGSPLSQLLARSDGNLYANLRLNPSASKWGGADIPLIPTPLGHRVYCAQHVVGGKLVEMWAAKDVAPDLSKPALIWRALSWPLDGRTTNIQVGVYRGQLLTQPTVAYLGRVGFSASMQQAMNLAGWGTVVPQPPPPAGLNVRELSRTTTTIKLGWTPSLPGVTGYKLIRPDGRISWSTNPAQASANFTLLDGTYRVEALSVPFSGSYQT